MLRERKIPDETAAARGERAGEVGSQSATRRPPRCRTRPPLSLFPSDTTLVCQANQHARTQTHAPRLCDEGRPPGWLVGVGNLVVWLAGWLAAPFLEEEELVPKRRSDRCPLRPGLQGRTGFLSVKWLLLGKRKCVLSLGCERVQILRLESRIATTNIIGPPCSGRGKAQSTSWDWQLCVK